MIYNIRGAGFILRETGRNPDASPMRALKLTTVEFSVRPAAG
jgi:hypothetical protein